MAETQKRLKKLQDDYNRRMNSSSEQSQTVHQIGQKKGFFTSLWPILSLSNFLDNYSQKHGLLYALFHPKEDYQKGKGIVFPNAVNYFSALAKRVSTKLYGIVPSEDLEKNGNVAPLLIDEILEKTLSEKKFKLKKLEQLINKGLDKFKQLSDEKSIHKRNLLFAIKQFLKDSNSQQLQAEKLNYPRWNESSNLFGSQVKALIESAERLHKEIRNAESLSRKYVKEELQELNTVDDSQLARPKSIERIVCSGGGAKGVVYPGSYKAMVDTGVYEGAKELSGASAGAITAALMAVGMENHSVRSQLLTTNFKDLMGSVVKEVGPGISSVFGKTITQTGALLLEFIERNINTSVKSGLSATVRD